MYFIFLVCRNESEFLDEWIQYHLGLNFDKIIILDDNSTDNTKEILEPYIRLNLVDYFKEDVSKYCTVHRTKFFNMYKEKYPFEEIICFYIDIDEFIFIENNNIKLLNNLDFENFNIQEVKLSRKTKETGFHIYNNNIYYLYNIYKKKQNYNHITKSKPVLKFLNKSPNFPTAHHGFYNEENKFKILKKIKIGYYHFHLLSLEEMLNKMNKYNPEKCNPYYLDKNKLIKYFEKSNELSKKKFNLPYENIDLIFTNFYNNYNFLFIKNSFDIDLINLIKNKINSYSIEIYHLFSNKTFLKYFYLFNLDIIKFEEFDDYKIKILICLEDKTIEIFNKKLLTMKLNKGDLLILNRRVIIFSKIEDLIIYCK